MLVLRNSTQVRGIQDFVIHGCFMDAFFRDILYHNLSQGYEMARKAYYRSELRPSIPKQPTKTQLIVTTSANVREIG